MDEKVKKIEEKLKLRLRRGEIGTVSCKILSKGNGCDCSLCLVDDLLSLLSSQEKKIEELTEGIEKHKEGATHYGHYHRIDEELYKLIGR